MAGGVAVIKVGAATEVELKEKKHRIEDAVSATRAAIEEGVVAGGGTASDPYALFFEASSYAAVPRAGDRLVFSNGIVILAGLAIPAADLQG